MSPGRRVYVLRHSEAASDNGRGDFHRALTQRGNELAARLGEVLKEAGASIDLALCSPATRAVQTLDGVLQGLGQTDVARRLDKQFYGGSAQDWIDAIKATDNNASQLLLVGHAPVMPALVAGLGGEDVSMRPCSAWALRFSGEWGELSGRDVDAELVFKGLDG